MRVEVTGRAEGPTLLFVHGWPDTARVWRHLLTDLGRDHRCIAVTLPGCGDVPGPAGGVDFPELVARLVGVIARHRRGDERVVLVTHDWGAWLGYLLERAHPALVRGMVACDVGGHVAPDTPVAILGFVAYQWAAASCFVLGRVAPSRADALVRRLAVAIHVPPDRATSIHARAGYFYLWFWRGLLRRRDGVLLPRDYVPRCPVLFLYGEHKELMFHSPRWEQVVASTGGRVVGIERAGHWFIEKVPEVVAPYIRDFVAALPMDPVRAAG